jgi:putative exosortase-associated protein (TIGR04073 family)
METGGGRMKRSLAGLIGVAAAVALVAQTPSASAEPMEGSKAFMKLTRGAVNLITGWVEIPKRVHETSQTSGAWAGFTWGLLRGIGHGFIRTAAGAYELVTFPFPAPPGYESVISPEYVFSEDGPSSYK